MAKQTLTAPPIAQQRPHRFTHHGITIEDPYHWLKDQSYPTVDDEAVLRYLKAENAYFESYMQPHKALVETLFEELKERQPEADQSVPYSYRGYRYQWRFEKDAQYRQWLRAPQSQPEQWSVMLDEVGLADGHDYFRLGGLAVSPSGRYLAYSTDTNGSERYTLVVKDLTTGEHLATRIENTTDSPVWSRDEQYLYYTELSEEWRPYQVRRHTLGTEQSDDVIYTESDKAYFVDLEETQSEAYVLITAGDHITQEVHFFPADHTGASAPEPKLVSPRRSGHEYYVDHRGEHFFIRSNRNHKNFELAKVAVDSPAEANWETVITPSDETYLTGHLVFAEFIALEQRVDGLEQIRVRHETDGDHVVALPDASYTVGLGTNPNFETSTLRLSYESMVTPDTVFSYDLKNRQLSSLKVREIPSGYNRDDYATLRLNAPARDGVEVPISIVYHKDFPRDGSGKLYLYGYGAYGASIPPSFSTSRLSILDRGFAFAIAHIRGGDDLGYHWYEDGKLDKRTNTFNDFVDVARYLVKEGFSQPGKIAIAGGSAGGELMGAAVNQAPELWGAVAAHVPFVDVLNTMLDTSLPLTPIEWPEWGNPIEDADAFRLIQSYSPYDQLKAGAYPPMLVTAGLNDPRVTYWEPAKYVAKLRTLKQDSTPLVFKTNMGAGHGGKSGRFNSLYETAEEYAFFLVNL